MLKLAAAFFATGLSFLGVSTLPPAGTTFQPAKIGAGGWVRGLATAPDGTLAARTDTYGAYYRSGASWVQVFSTLSMPSGDPMASPTSCANATANCGVYELQIAPSNSNVAYMMVGGYTYVTTNFKSAPNLNWTATAFPQCTACNSNQSNSQSGPHIAIDPADPSKVAVGTYNGLYYSNNYGAAVSGPVASIPAPTGATTGQGLLVAYDSSTTSGGATLGIYVSSYGNGVYHSNAGAAGPFTLTSGGPPTSHLFMTIPGADGVLYYITDADSSCTIWIYNGSAWSTKTANCNGGNLAGIAVNPAHATFASNAYISVINAGGAFSYSTNSGSNWSPSVAPSRACTGDVAWLCVTNETYMTAGQIAYDPSQANTLYFSEGIGVWSGTPSTSPMTWQAASAGIEQMVSTSAKVAPGGRPMFTFWDRPIFTPADLTLYPTAHGVNYAASIILGADVDFAKTAPSTAFVAADWGGLETSGITRDGGGGDGSPSNWALCGSYPSAPSPNAAWGTVSNGGNGYTGSVAASTPDNFIWALSNNAALWYTLDRCATWHIVQPTGIVTSPAGANQGWNGAYYLNRRITCADDTPGYFYVYNAGSNAGSSSSAGIYKLWGGGASGALAKSGNFDSFDNYNSQLGCVPGVSGEMFWTSGNVTPGPYPHNESFYDCVDGSPGSPGGTITCSAVANVKEVWAFGFGAKKPGGIGYPAIFIIGWVSNVYGLWESDDHAATWTQLSAAPCNSLDTPSVVAGDPNVYRRVYVGFHGSSFCFNP